MAPPVTDCSTLQRVSSTYISFLPGTKDLKLFRARRSYIRGCREALDLLDDGTGGRQAYAKS
jgi:hypothetical protein